MNRLPYVSLLLFLLGCYGSEPHKTGKEGTLLPVFSIQLPDSTSFLNTANIPYGNKSVFFLFGPNCPYSRAQMKTILDKIEDFGSIRFYLITNYSLHDMRDFYNHFQLSKYPNIIVGRDTGYVFTDFLEVPGVPYIAFYNSKKKLVKSFTGKIYSSQIKSAIRTDE